MCIIRAGSEHLGFNKVHIRVSSIIRVYIVIRVYIINRVCGLLGCIGVNWGLGLNCLL